MSPTAIAVVGVPNLAPADAHVEGPPLEQIAPKVPGAARRILGWLKEGLLLVGVVYAFAIAILAIGIPVALTINGLLIAAAWAWQAIP